MKFLFLSAGFMSLGLGVIGIVLPILPTTPFLILTGFLFTKSSDRYANWFKNTKIYKKYLSEFIENRTMTKRNKWTLLLFVDLMLLVSYISVPIIILRIFIIILIIAKHWYFFRYIKTT
jgi:uncharacterized membrane protein YbaN (DUF454 family)